MPNLQGTRFANSMHSSAFKVYAFASKPKPIQLSNIFPPDRASLNFIPRQTVQVRLFGADDQSAPNPGEILIVDQMGVFSLKAEG